MDGKAAPPTYNYPLPDFVQKRIDWLQHESKVNGALSPLGQIKFLINIDNEKKLEREWNFGAMTDYQPVSKEYRDWINHPILEDMRKLAVAIAVIYGTPKRDEENEEK